jgi:hypothetical protein
MNCLRNLLGREAETQSLEQSREDGDVELHYLGIFG